MKYIIAEPDEQNSLDLKRILDGYEILEYQGSFTTLEIAESSIRRDPPDIAFIRVGKAELNAFQLSCMIRRINPYSKVVFISDQEEYAVDAFECEAYGFLSMPFDEEKIRLLLLRNEKQSYKNT